MTSPGLIHRSRAGDDHAGVEVGHDFAGCSRPTPPQSIKTARPVRSTFQILDAERGGPVKGDLRALTMLYFEGLMSSFA
jgi:hypothetical protein